MLHELRRVPARARLALGLARRLVRVRLNRPRRGEPRVYYGIDRLPQPGERMGGGIIKFQRLERVFPNTPRGFNILYLGSSSRPPDAVPLAAAAQRSGATFVWNQNGVGYPAWTDAWEAVNAPMHRLLHAADYVFFQSEFCKLSADTFLGERERDWEILYNAVDTSHFAPRTEPLPDEPLVVLLGGNQYEHYRLEAALGTLAALRRSRPDARLLVSGALSWPAPPGEAVRWARAFAEELGVQDAVEYVGMYSQRDAPGVLRRAHILLHTKALDPCPSAVIEAMACGLPVVYSATGGTPELVGDDAGIGVVTPATFDHTTTPDPDLLAEALLAVAADRERYAANARRRAVERFDLAPWLARHREVFSRLLGS